MKRHSLLIGLLCLLVAISACGMQSVKHGAVIDEAKVKNSVIDGKTSESDVVMEFGSPTKTMENPKRYIYEWSETSKSTMPLYGQTTTVTYNLIILFDDNGVVKSHKIAKTAEDSKKGFGEQKEK
ncbi:MAG: hypothetical protein ACLP9S_06720 [Syntrophales bacterium]